MYMFFDWTYLVFIVPCALFAMWASSKVQSTYKKYSKVFSNSGLLAQDVARKMLDDNGLRNIKIEKISGNLTDHYDPKEKVIRLSESVYDSSSTAAIGVACHEVGHAIQHDNNYAPLRLRNAIIPITNIGSNLAWPLILIGLIFQRNSTPTFAYIGIILFSTAVLFQLFTLPTEFDASKRAMDYLSGRKFLTTNELSGIKQVLDAAALTYVAALATAIAQMLRLIFIVLNNSNRNRD